MRFAIAAAFALIAASSLEAQTAPAPASPVFPDLSQAVPIAGNWTYAATPDGSEVTFTDASARPQLWLRCTRATRQLTVAKAASAAAPFLAVWTSSLTRNLPASFNPATARLSATLATFDPLLDAMTFSRGRIGVGVSAAPPLVVPPWAEVGRVIEDCRS